MITNQYDSLIKRSTEKYLPWVDWRLIKAQLLQESKLNPDAKSHVGAMGIAQFMPKTWAEIVEKMSLPLSASAYDPDYAIPACCFYMAKLYGKWKAKRPEMDKWCLTLVSYNAGTGNLLKAQKLAGGANDYASIIKALPGVTGSKNAKETTDYAIKILGYYTQLVTVK
jgi:soluble lytic murein transglycosylase-like protein